MSIKQCIAAFAQPILQLALIAAVVFGVSPVPADLQDELFAMVAVLLVAVIADALFTATAARQPGVTRFHRLLVRETGFQVLAVAFVLLAAICAWVTIIVHTTTGSMVWLVPIALLSASYSLYRAVVARHEVTEMIDEASCFYRVA